MSLLVLCCLITIYPEWQSHPSNKELVKMCTEEINIKVTSPLASLLVLAVSYYPHLIAAPYQRWHLDVKMQSDF